MNKILILMLELIILFNTVLLEGAFPLPERSICGYLDYYLNWSYCIKCMIIELFITCSLFIFIFFLIFSISSEHFADSIYETVQTVVMPILGPLLGEETLLCIGLFAGFLNVWIYHNLLNKFELILVCVVIN